MEAGPSEKKRKTAGPSYDAPWWRFYEQIKDASGVMLSGRCKVKNCKVFYRYSKTNGLSAFKKHADKYVTKNEEPHDQPDPHLVQSVINTDGSRTQQRYDEKGMLSEFTRYITQKEQPISMGNCLSFAQLVIRGCGQPLYKRFHHRKMVTEIKRQYNEHKNDLLATFGYVNYEVSITSDIWTTDKHGLCYSCVTAHYIDEN
jgi:YD repeat-containing protein